jgi:hypothetical protein
MLKRADWRTLQWIEATPAEPMQMELSFPRFTRWRTEPDSPQLALLFPSVVSTHDASLPDNADESSDDIHRMGGRKNK